MNIDNVLTERKEQLKEFRIPLYPECVHEDDYDYYGIFAGISRNDIVFHISNRHSFGLWILLLLFDYACFVAMQTVLGRIEQIGWSAVGIIVVGSTSAMSVVALLLTTNMLRQALTRGLVVVNEHNLRIVRKSVFSTYWRWTTVNHVGVVMFGSRCDANKGRRRSGELTSIPLIFVGKVRKPDNRCLKIRLEIPARMILVPEDGDEVIFQINWPSA